MSDPNRPTRHPILWETEDFYDEAKLDGEMRRVFDICHGCRRCFNLCDSFPKLFDLVDESEIGEVESVVSSEFKDVVEACTLCDMCFVNKCPYVPPHEFDIDFPHLMLRAKAVEAKKNGTSFMKRQLANVDLMNKIGSTVAKVSNWMTDEKNTPVRMVIEKVAGIHKSAVLPKFHSETFVKSARKNPLPLNKKAPGFGEKVVLYATCFGNYHNPTMAHAAYSILAHNGVEANVVYPQCCGMPLLENGDIEKVVKGAKKITAELLPWVNQGYTVLALVPSCTLMLKQEWPLLLPKDKNVRKVSRHTMDISEYLVKLFKEKGIASGLTSLGSDVTLHLACHSRAQNMGQKAAELLRLIPDTKVEVIERCSGHGGTWGMMVDHFDVALKIGEPVFKKAESAQNHYIASECPFASSHIKQGMEIRALKESNAKNAQINEDVKSASLEKTHADQAAYHENTYRFEHLHPIEIFAKAYGL